MGRVAVAVSLLAIVGAAAADDGPRYRVRIDPEFVAYSGEGVIAERRIFRELGRSRAALAACATEAAEAGEPIPEELEAGMRIETDGYVDDPYGESPDDSRLVTCVRGVITGFRFDPPPRDGWFLCAVLLHFEEVASP